MYYFNLTITFLKITFYKDGFTSTDFSKLIKLGKQIKSPWLIGKQKGWIVSQVETQPEFQDFNVSKIKGINLCCVLTDM